jgi:hypothetical protein
MVSGSIPRTVLTMFCGMVIGALLFGAAGGVSDRILMGSGIGAPLGALVAYGMMKHWLGAIVVWVTVCAIAALIGTGCDADPIVCTLFGAAFGAFLGLTGWWRGTLVVCATWIGGAIGFAVGGSFNPNPAAGVLGAAAGLCLAWFVGYKVLPKKRRPNTGLESE